VARCSAAGVGVTNLPTTARGPNLYCSADGGLRLREVGVFNTTANAVSVGLGVATALGTVAGAATEFCEDDPGHTVLGIVNTSHSADATIAAVWRYLDIRGEWPIPPGGYGQRSRHYLPDWDGSVSRLLFRLGRVAR
jgi:hypothetical protein